MRTIKKSLFPIIALCALAVLLVTACKDEDDPAPSAPATFTVTFNSNGGTDVDSITDLASGATIEAPANLTKGGFEFVAWFKDAEFENEWDFEEDTVTANITLYAKWTDIRTELTAGAADPTEPAADADTTVTVTFGGATGVTGLAATDFTITPTAAIGTPTVGEDGAVSLTITLPANDSTENTVAYTVGIASTSTKIKGSVTVTFTQAAKAGG
ncbi:hypothetical protein PilKf_02300 [Pillotina sp. SPG140]|jgi:uncharacterized repeat protein (TIGR02543 family)